MEMPIVSVHMITYNHAPFIRKAIQGVLQQKTEFPFELIIGEDFSTDGTREIVYNFQMKYPEIIKVITSERNVGAKENSIRVFEACKGKYIAFCEGDDYWNNNRKLQKQITYMETHPECGLIYSSYDVYHVKYNKYIKDFIKYKKRLIPSDLSIADVINGVSGILTCTTIIRKDMYKKVIEADWDLLYNANNSIGDTQLWAEMASYGKIYYLAETLATHIITEESVTRSNDIKKKLKFEISAASIMLRLCDKHNIDKFIRKKHEDNYYYSNLQLSFFTKNSLLADEIRMKKGKFTLKEKLYYLGTKNFFLYYMLLLFIKIRTFFMNKNYEWM